MKLLTLAIWILSCMLTCLHADVIDAINTTVLPGDAENDELSKTDNSTKGEIDQSYDDDIVDDENVYIKTAAANQTGNANDDDVKRRSSKNQPPGQKRRHGKNRGNQRRRHPHRDKIEKIDENNSTKDLVGKSIEELQDNVKDMFNDTKVVGNASVPAEENKCSNCDPKQREVDYRIEMVKAQLLQKLGMSEPPKVDGPIHPLPFDFYVGENFAINDEPDDDEDGDNFGKVRTREIFVFGDDGKRILHR